MGQPIPEPQCLDPPPHPPNSPPRLGSRHTHLALLEQNKRIRLCEVCTINKITGAWCRQTDRGRELARDRRTTAARPLQPPTGSRPCAELARSSGVSGCPGLSHRELCRVGPACPRSITTQLAGRPSRPGLSISLSLSLSLWLSSSRSLCLVEPTGNFH